MSAWSSWFGSIFTDRDLKKVTRFEVIETDGDGRVYVRGPRDPITLECSLQDDGRTLKVFVKRQASPT